MRKTASDPATHKLLVLVVFVTIAFALWAAQDVFVPIALALLLSFVLTPVADWLEHRGLPRAVSAVFVVVTLCLATLGMGYVVGDQVYKFAMDLPQYRDEIAAKAGKLRGVGGSLEKTINTVTQDFGGTATTVPTTEPATQPAAASSGSPAQAVASVIPAVGPNPLAQSPSTTQPVGTTPENPLFTQVVNAESPLSNIATYLGFALGPLGTAGIVLVLLLFLLLERDDIRDRFIRLSSSGRYTLTTQALQDATIRISRYLRAQLIVNGSYGVAIAIGLWAIGAIFGHGTSFPSVILWGTLCAVLRFIPYVGPWVAAAFPITVSLAVFEGFGVFFATTTMFVVVELISNNIMEPMLYGSSTGLSTVALLVSALIWTWLWGPVGLLLATPLTVCLVVLGKHVPQLKFLDVLLGDQPALAPGVRVYQRLLAGRHEEARDVVKEIRDETGDLAAAVDQALVPALRLTRQDRAKDELTSEEEQQVYKQLTILLEDERKRERDNTPGDVYPDRPRFIATPAHHRAECIVASALAWLVEPMGAEAESLACSLLPADVEDRIESSGTKTVFVCVLPPGGVAQARYLCRRLRRRFKDLTIIVGYFGTYRDYDSLLVRFRAAGASHVVTSLEQARGQLAAAMKLKLPEKAPKSETSTVNATDGVVAAPVRGAT